MNPGARVAAAVPWSTAPGGLDSIAHDLRAMRSAAGDPSFAEVARRIAAARAARGVPAHERRMPRSTLYDCFQDGRRRIDSDAVVEIALALGLPARLRADWSARIHAARAATDGAEVATARSDLPAPVDTFTGRTEVLTRIAALLDGTAAPGTSAAGTPASGAVWVQGMAGAGKTQVALQTARTRPGAVLLDLRGARAEAVPVAPDAAQRALLRMLDLAEVDGEDSTDRARRLREALRETGRLLVLDDARDADQVVRIVGEGASGPVLVTSRAAAPAGWAEVPLPGLTADETTDLLRAFAPADGGAEVTAADSARLRAVLDGLPLAVSLVGARLAERPGWTLADHVDLIGRRVAAGRVDAAVEAELDLSYSGLPEAPSRLLRGLASLPVGEVGPEAMAAILDAGPEDARHAAGVLLDRSLAIRRGEGRIALHSLVRAFALARAEETDPPRARRAAFGRVGQLVTDRVWAAYATIARSMGDAPRLAAFTYPELDWTAEAAQTWLAAHLDGALALAHQAPEHGHPALLFRLSEGLSWWLALAGRSAEALTLHEAAADLAAEVGDADALAMASLDAGQILLHGQRPDAALEHFARATRLVQDAGDLTDPGVAGVLRSMEAIVRMREGDLDRAAQLLREAVALHAERGEDARLMSARVNLCVVLHLAGQSVEAAEVVEAGLELAVATGHRMFESYLLINRARLRVEAGDGEAEVGERDESAAEAGERDGSAAGDRGWGDSEGALEDARAALALAQELDVAYLRATAHGAAADALGRMHRLEEATSEAEAAVREARAIGDALGLAEQLIITARVAVGSGATDWALEVLDEVDGLLDTDVDHALRGHALQIRARLVTDREERADALRRARDAFERAGARTRVAELDRADLDRAGAPG